MNNTMRIAIACFVGGAIGALIALELGYLWFVGILVGGVIGYLTEDLPAVVRTTRSNLRSSFKIDWKQERAAALLLVWHLNAVSIMIAVIVGLMGLALFTEAVVFENSTADPTYGQVTFRTESSPSIIALGCLIPLVTFFLSLRARLVSEAESDELWNQAKKYNLLTLQFWHIPRWPCIGMLKVLRFTPIAMKATREFCWDVFIEVHSKRRLLCGVDAMLGATVGYFVGYAVVGGIGGLLFGLTNYEMISKRVLRVGR